MNLQDTVYTLHRETLHPRCIGYICEDTEPDYSPSAIDFTPKIVTALQGLYENAEKSSVCVSYRLFQIAAASLSFGDLEFCPGQKVYWFFCVVCGKDTDVVMTLESTGYQRLWIDGRPVALWGRGNRMPLTYTLHKGRNIICLEQYDAQPFMRAHLRINPLSQEAKLPSNSIVGNLLTYRMGGIYIWEVNDASEYRNGKPFCFIINPMDYVWISPDAPVEILVRLRKTGEVLATASCKMMEPSSIETAPLRFFQKDPMHCLELVFRYPLLDGNVREHITFFHVIPHENYIRPLVERATALLERGGLSEEEIRCIQYQLNTVTRERESTPETFVQWESFHEYLEKMEEGSYLKSLNEGGFHTLYMHSKLDDSVIYYHVCLPDGYRPEKKHPLLISFSILQMDDTSKSFAGVRDLEDVIVADIHGRGITMGSYIGDASIKEILQDLFARYPIDFSRIYAMGFCSGAAAAWSQVQYAPDLYAGVYACIYMPVESMTKNLCNTSFHYLCGQKDMHLQKSRIQRLHRYISDLHINAVRDAVHLDYHDIFYCKDAIRSLMHARKRQYPREIYFRTDKNRYLKSAWITIHSIACGKTYAEVHALIQNNEIHITAKNLTGLTVQIPPFIQQQKVKIIINRKPFVVDAADGCCRFVRGAHGFAPSKADAPRTPIFKGNGCLDVFLNPVRIINYHPENAEYSKAAKGFSSPKNMGFYCETQIQYPVYTPEYLDKHAGEILPNNSLIVFCDADCQSDILQKIRENSRIYTDAGGFRYLDTYYRQPYCILQILENPWNPEMSILTINCNSVPLLSQNIFTRSVILPTYHTGYHPYLNAVALLYDGCKYSAVREFGMEPENVDHERLQLEM